MRFVRNIHRGSTDHLACLCALIVFAALVVTRIGLPGLYMDAVNPDFLAAQLLDHKLHNPSGGLPSKIFPLLGNLYHGTQNVYMGLPFFVLFGFSVAALRLAQAAFGAILLVALHSVVRRLTGSSLLALSCTLGLATELAFTASFRTQFYIVLGGAAWLFVSLALAIPIEGTNDSRKRTLLSGVFAGLAGYGYFVLLFFVPGQMLLIALRRQSGWRDLLPWFAGLALGMTPFALGYLSLMLKLHGVEPTLSFIHSLLSQLHPFDASGASHGNLAYAWDMARLAITDDANEGMIFGQPLGSAWGTAKFYLFVVTLVTASLCLAFRLIRRDARATTLLPVLLPISFIAVASLFGHRLWAHHFSVLIPFTYLLTALVLSQLPGIARSATLGRLAVFALLAACMICNLSQQTAFHKELARTGGAAKMPEAINMLATEARSASRQEAYVFPEWGFYTSFAFLTANRVRYVIDGEQNTFAKLRSEDYRRLRLAYWDSANRERYRHSLQAAGFHTIDERTYMRRDGKVAFYLLEAE